MTQVLSITLIIGVVCYFVIIISLLKKKLLSLKYSLLWLATGLGLLILAIFPEILYKFSKLIGIEVPVNGLFLLIIAFLFMIVMSITVIVSKQSERIRIMAQKVALLEKRLRDIEKREEYQD